MFEPIMTIALPLLLFTGLLIGILHLFFLFGLLYALPVILLLGGAILQNKRKNISASLTLMLIAGTGQLLSFFSWILSRHAIDGGDAFRTWASDMPSIAVAGFPFAALELPPPPMGSDGVPQDMWLAVFFNHWFWFIVGAIIVLAFLSFWKKPLPKYTGAISTGVAIFALLYNLALFALWFD